VSVQASALNLQLSVLTTNAWRTRTLAVILMVAIAGIFWVDSGYPALPKRYHAGTQVKAGGVLTLGTVYQVGGRRYSQIWMACLFGSGS
jgi:hypothetical protein